MQVQGLSIKSVRVGGVEIPNNKRIEFSLQYIHGVGRVRARKILCDLNMDNKITKELSEEELITLRDEVSKYMIEGDLVCACACACSSHFLNFCFVLFNLFVTVWFNVFAGFSDGSTRLI